MHKLQSYYIILLRKKLFSYIKRGITLKVFQCGKRSDIFILYTATMSVSLRGLTNKNDGRFWFSKVVIYPFVHVAFNPTICVYLKVLICDSTKQPTYACIHNNDCGFTRHNIIIYLTKYVLYFYADCLENLNK